MFWTEFAADKGVNVLNQLRIELVGFSPGAVWSAGFAVVLFRRCIAALGYGAV